jgi:hypothetical protein
VSFIAILGISGVFVVHGIHFGHRPYLGLRGSTSGTTAFVEVLAINQASTTRYAHKIKAQEHACNSSWLRFQVSGVLELTRPFGSLWPIKWVILANAFSAD